MDKVHKYPMNGNLHVDICLVLHISFTGNHSLKLDAQLSNKWGYRFKINKHTMLTGEFNPLGPIADNYIHFHKLMGMFVGSLILGAIF